MNDHQALQPQVRPVFRTDGQTDEERGERHHAIAEQVIVEKQPAPLIVQDPHGLLIQRLQADRGRLRIIDEQNQHGVDSRKHHSDICGYPRGSTALMMKTSCHHDITDGQEHADQIGSEIETDDDAQREKEYRYRNDRGACRRYGPVHTYLFYLP